MPDETVRRILECGMPQFTQHTLRSLVLATAHDIAQEVEMAAHLEVHPAEDSLAATGAGA
jgi:hypothetical protein